ncbi:MAG: ABC transporter permease [Candidatus Tectomicrobia bacterium]|nr:ABC transporter permease [Candidatus Tectomicrobia bacterium]
MVIEHEGGISLEPTSRARLWHKFMKNPIGLLGLLILATVVFCAVFSPWVAPHSPTKQSLINRFAPPAWVQGGSIKYLLGTDQVGRDILSRIVYGARISLIVGIFSVTISLMIGVTLGLISGFLGGRIDQLIMTVVDIMLAFPGIILALAFVAVLGPSLKNIIIVLGVTGWERYARVVRAETLAFREQEFVIAARAIGASSLKIMARHIFPNTISSIIVMGTLQTATNILAEASLSFLGLAPGSTNPTWGQMIATSRDFVSVAWWLPTFPGFAILLTVLAINLVGDRLRDVLDPKVL